MVFERYSSNMKGKVWKMVETYSSYIFNEVGALDDIHGFQTACHIRSVPTDGWERLSLPHNWGGEWNNLWVKGVYTVPEEAAGLKLYAVPKITAEEILFFINGKPMGIFNSKSDYIGGLHSAQLITAFAVPGEEFELAFECYAGHFVSGVEPLERYNDDCLNYDKGEFNKIVSGVDICSMDCEVKDFVFDMRAVLQLSDLPANNFISGRAKNAVEKLFIELTQYPARIERDKVHNLAVTCRGIMKPILSLRGGDGMRGKVGVVGHSHMDTAWLWPVCETIRKCVRTYSNVLTLMEQYPEFTFVQSSALHLDWMRRYYPAIFEGIRKRVAEGRYEPNGGAYVECDCNITSGELMIRQFLKGQLFTRKYLNYTSDAFWLPDTFGYNGMIPQIMCGSEVKYFYTTKISWGDLNEFPYDTFIWQGVDGSRVLTHFNRIHSYPDIKSLESIVNDIKDKQVYDGRLLAYGFGDGGGGPTYGMLEDARRADNMAGVPELRYTTISGFMKDIEQNAENLPVFSGELYLECHRGTLTQMHDIKRNNRKAEFALRDMEYFNVLANKPKNAKSDELYEITMINQFHDILPGTSIMKVNETTRKEMIAVIKSAKEEAEKYAADMVENNVDITLFNTLSFGRNDVVYIEDSVAVPADKPYQCFTDVCGRKLTAVGEVAIPGFGMESVKMIKGGRQNGRSVFKYDGNNLETPFMYVSFDENGCISSLIDKTSGRQLRRKGGAPLNTFYLGEDIPNDWDNWDIDYDQALKMKPTGKLTERSVISDGQVEFRIRSKYEITNNTSLVQDMVFNAAFVKIDFHTLINWNEKQQMLKAGFDCDIMTTCVKNEIQFGYMERLVNRNYPFEVSKFEVCNHKWSDLSESRFGVALLNDCKYGISVNGSDMRLTLHRGGIRPDITGDSGVHEMTYSLLPHTGPFSAESVVYPAYMLNVPVYAVKGRLKSSVQPPVKISAPNVICEAAKPAELVENAYIVRLYEAERNKTKCTVTLPTDAKRCCVTNMLEDIRKELDINNSNVELEFEPFKIITLLVQRS